jgi:molybdenum cofactor guanylyltransferase
VSDRCAPPPGKDVIAGIFVGGAGRRMGGRPKGMLVAPGGGTLIDHWLAVLHAAGICQVLLVGRHEAYGALGLERIHDAPSGIGPIGGLAALLLRSGVSRALALACDMPFVSLGLIARLLAAPDAPVVAPRREGVWEPLCARYDAHAVLPVTMRRIAAGRHSLQPLLAEAGAVELPLTPADRTELHDWDTPSDMLPRDPGFVG